ncbi:MAG TPA: alpha/beta fold hydrolase [Polyangiaceae bacterium]|nr:alpha/beta fold hydrolase [Polyangiaceae bacterium]
MLHGHIATLAPFVRHVLAPAKTPSQPWNATLHDPDVGPVQLTGLWREYPGARSLLLVVHGLGGSATSHYTIPAAVAANAAKMSCLRLNLRGADLSGTDFYHAGLTADLRAALAALPPRYEHIYVLGYSMGGHVALRYAAESPEARVRAIASVCAPLDLERSATDFDRRTRAFYRYHVLSGLKRIYARVAKRRRVAFPIDEALRIGKIRSWDRHVVAPRFGFASAEDYYARASAIFALPSIARPTLVVAAKADPMVPEPTLRAAVSQCSASVDWRWVERGGHVGFPPDLDLGMRGERGLERQILEWFARAA